MVFSRNQLWLIAGVVFLAGVIPILSIKTPYIALAAAATFLLLMFINKTELFFYAFLCSLMLTPKFSLGINFRLEDGITIFFAAQLTVMWMNRKHVRIPTDIWKAILIYLGFSLIVSLGYIVTGSLPAIYLMFWLKDVQYILYFVIAFYCTMRNAKTVNKVINLLFITTICWGIYQIIAHRAFGYYGIGIISEPASSQSGGAFFIITLYMFYRLQMSETKKHKLFYLALTLSSLVITLSTVSRTAISALLVTSVLLVPIYLLQRRKSVIRLYFAVWVLIGLYFGFSYVTRLMGDLAGAIVIRIGRTSNGASERWENWQHLLSANESLISKIIGMGKGFPQTVTGGYTLAADSQYVRLLSEVGIVGLILFLVVILYIMRFCLRNRKIAKPESTFLFMMTLGFMVMGVTHEVFEVTIQASMFWTLTGVFMAQITTIRERSEAYVSPPSLPLP